MYESLLPERARPAYRASRWKNRLDERTKRLEERGYTPRTLGIRLREWVDFTSQFQDRELPTDYDAPEVVAYLERRCPGRTREHGPVHAALRLLLEPEEALVLRFRPEAPPRTALCDQHVPTYLAFVRQHRGHQPSAWVEAVLVKFFAWLDIRGVDEVGRIGPAEARDFLAEQAGLAPSTVGLEASILRGFVHYLSMSGLVSPNFAKLIESPRLYRRSAPPEVLDEETIDRLLGAIDRATPLGKRNYAILLLAARYGMRPSDIRNLKLDDIHWREQRLLVVQRKTMRPLELPLLEDIDIALVGYLRDGRPDCSVREVFVRHVPPIGPLATSGALWQMLQRTFEAAGMTPPQGRRGMSLLRHSAASRMLAQGVVMDTISDVLGHASVESTRVYTHVDIQGLRSVALSASEVSP